MNKLNLLKNIIIALIIIGILFIAFALYLHFSATNPANPAYNSNSQKSLVILKAIYGTAKGSADVTAKLNSLIKNNALNTVASNELAGDPDFGTVKTLQIQYSMNGTQFTKTYKENDSVILP